MKWLALLLATGATLAGALAFTASASGQADKQAAPIFVTTIPPGYRDWKLISVAHEEGTLNSFAAVLGNDVAIKAYRDAKLPFPAPPQADRTGLLHILFGVGKVRLGYLYFLEHGFLPRLHAGRLS